MKPTHARAFTLLHVLTVAAFAGLITTAATLTITRCLRIQHRVASWNNDEAVTRTVLQRLRNDVHEACTANLATESTTALVLHGREAEVRYAVTDHVVERIEQREDGMPTRCTWPIERTSLQWTIERVGNETLVWTRVEIVDPITRKAPMTHRYGVGVRCCGIDRREEQP